MAFALQRGMPLRSFKFLRVLIQAVQGFRRHQAPRLGAALAFYTLLSLSPLLLVVLAVLGAVFGPDAARGAIASQIETLVGNQGAQAIEALVANANQPERGWVSALLGGLVLVFGASGVFVELKESLDIVWEVPPEQRGQGVRGLAADRLLAFTAICGLTFLLLVSLILSAVFSAVGDRFARYTGLEVALARIANFAVSFFLTASLFGMMFRLLPAKRPPWSQVWFGAIVTTLLFLAGKMLIGLYLGQAAVGSAYGAAGSLVVLLVWIYYSTQILLFGAELTQAWNGGAK